MLHLVFPLAALLFVGFPQDPSPAVQPAPVTNDAITFTQAAGADSQSVCYKMRTYIFERNDGAAPKLVRETTCPPVHPRLNRSHARARIIPAD